MHIIIIVIVLCVLFFGYKSLGRYFILIFNRPVMAIFGGLIGVAFATWLGNILGFEITVGHLWWKKSYLPGIWLWGWGIVTAVFFSWVAELYSDYKDGL